MGSFGIVISFNVRKYRKLKFLQGKVTVAVSFFFLEIFEKTFAAGIVKRTAFPGKRLHNMQRIQKLPECGGCVLGSPVGVKHQAIRSISFFVSFSEGSDNQLCIGTGRDMPGNDFSGVQIHHDTEIVPFPARFKVGDVADPYEIGCFLAKVLLQVVGAGSVIGTFDRDKRPISGHFRKLQLFHQSVHSADTDVYAIITLKNIGDLVSSESLVVICMDMKNQGRDPLIFSDTKSGLSRKVLVISASVDSEDPAEGLDAVLETELVNRV